MEMITLQRAINTEFQNDELVMEHWLTDRKTCNTCIEHFSFFFFKIINYNLPMYINASKHQFIPNKQLQPEISNGSFW